MFSEFFQHPKSGVPLNKSELYSKVKFVKGEKFVSVEDTKNLSNEELLQLIGILMEDTLFQTTPHVHILVSSKFDHEIDSFLLNNGFQLKDVKVNVYKDLGNFWVKEADKYTYRTLEQVSVADFKKVWAKSMEGSLNAQSSLSIDNQLLSVEKELGSDYKRTCRIVYEGGKQIGVILPHIEPGTVKEGRLFYFGLIPSERGKGKSAILHRQALRMLKSEFQADYYIGSTSYNNLPMLKTFQKNGCEVLETNKVYKSHLK